MSAGQQVLKPSARVVCGLLVAGLAAIPARGGAQDVPDDFLVKLERTICGGECPAYWVTIDASGTVTYEGTEFVRVQGRQTDKVPASRVAAILAAAERIDFFNLRDQYRTIRNPDGTETIVTDQPTAFLTIRRAGQSKRTENYIGAPQALKQLEQLVDDTARTKRWIRLDVPTLQQLVRDGRSPSAEERAELLRKAVQHDEVDVVTALLKIGADPNGAYSGTNTTPLMMVRSAAAARVLIEAGANPFATNDNGATVLGFAAYLAPDVTALLLKADVQVDAPTDSDGRTALWQAACGGNVGVVKLLLDAGANLALGPAHTSALDCAKQGKHMREIARLRRSVVVSTPPYREDFDGVIALLQRALANTK
jgi:hypothetical protein